MISDSDLQSVQHWLLEVGPGYYDRKGVRIANLLAWAQMFEDLDYKIVKQQHLWWGGFLSTVWLGLDHRFANDGPPLIFESMLFGVHHGPDRAFMPDKVDDMDEILWREFAPEMDMTRYAREEEALAGHRYLYRHWSKPQVIGRYLLQALWNSLRETMYSAYARAREEVQ
jgi:hypothetical protein